MEPIGYGSHGPYGSGPSDMYHNRPPSGYMDGPGDMGPGSWGPGMGPVRPSGAGRGPMMQGGYHQGKKYVYIY